MTGNEHTPRRYRSELRRSQVEGTRAQVLDAAAVLFEANGYEGTSIAAIAAAAGVSPETVYARFGTKRALIGELVRRAVRGDEEAPVLEQAGPRAVAAATDQREQLRLFAADISRRLERAAPLVGVISGAARSHPDLAQLLASLHAARLENFRSFIAALETNGPLKLPAADALETVWALTSPELHQLLKRERGWSSRRYRDWLAASLSGLLLDQTPRRSDNAD